MPALLSTSICFRSAKFQGLWNSVCGGDGGKYFVDSGKGNPNGERGINGGNEILRDTMFLVFTRKSFLDEFNFCYLHPMGECNYLFQTVLVWQAKTYTNKSL